MRFLPFAIALLFFCSCRQGQGKPDISGIRVNLKIERFEESYFKIDTLHMEQGLASIQQQYPQFYPLFAEVILGIPPADLFPVQPEAVRAQKNFLSNYRSLYDSIQDKYKNLGWLKDDLTEAFRYVKYYYPAYRIPGVITFIATLDQPGVAMTPHYLAIGLHQFAGKDFSGYKSAEVQRIYPEYITRRFDKEYITANCMKSVVDDIYPDTSQSASLVDQMIEKGKQWWLLQHFIPDAPDSIITGYTGRQTKWTEANEGNIWQAIQTNTPDLYTVDQDAIQNYIGEAPFTQNLETSNSSPGNLGPWIGLQIIKKFVQKNPGLKLQEVLQTPSRKIFQEANYRPK